MVNQKQLQRSFTYAFKGLKYVWQNEQNFRIQTLIAAAVIMAMVLLRVTLAESIVLSLLIIFVLVLEVINTIFEKMVDVLKPRMHSYVAQIKDMMAGAVLIASFGSVVIALMIFIPHLVDLFSNI